MPHLNGKPKRNKQTNNTYIKKKTRNGKKRQKEEGKLEVNAITGDGHCLLRAVSFDMCGRVFYQEQKRALIVDFTRKVDRT